VSRIWRNVLILNMWKISRVKKSTTNVQEMAANNEDEDALRYDKYINDDTDTHRYKLTHIRIQLSHRAVCCSCDIASVRDGYRLGIVNIYIYRTEY